MDALALPNIPYCIPAVRGINKICGKRVKSNCDIVRKDVLRESRSGLVGDNIEAIIIFRTGIYTVVIRSILIAYR